MLNLALVMLSPSGVPLSCFTCQKITVITLSAVDFHGEHSETPHTGVAELLTRLTGASAILAGLVALALTRHIFLKPCRGQCMLFEHLHLLHPYERNDLTLHAHVIPEKVDLRLRKQ